MASLIEFHGRLFRVDPGPEPDRTRSERLAEPGLYDLRVALHAGRDDLVALWSEVHRAVPVTAGGFFGVVLGEQEPVPPGFFDGTPRWLSATGLGDYADVQSARMPLLGHAVRVFEQLTALTARVAALEEAAATGGRRAVNLHRRLRRVERAPDGRSLDARLTRLDGPTGRVARLEDELEDVVGPDGDVIDIVERLERLEGVAPGKASVDPRTVDELTRRVDELAERVRALARPRK